MQPSTDYRTNLRRIAGGEQVGKAAVTPGKPTPRPAAKPTGVTDKEIRQVEADAAAERNGRGYFQLMTARILTGR